MFCLSRIESHCAGQAELSDLAVVLANFCASGVAWDAPGNVDHDRNVDIAGLVLVLGQFGIVCD